MRPFIFISGQICRLIGLYGWIFGYLKLKRIYWFAVVKLGIKGYKRNKINKIMRRFYYLKIDLPEKRKTRKVQLMMNDLVVEMSERYGIPQHEVREFLKESFYINT